MTDTPSTTHPIENVWDYPRPPALEKVSYRLQVIFNGETIADTTRGYRVLETTHPPTYYFPKEDIKMQYVKQSERRQTYCEFKGMCTYYHVNVNGKEQKDAAWSYVGPVERYKDMDGYISFYCSKMDECYVDGERATPQQSEFYGGIFYAISYCIHLDLVGLLPGSMEAKRDSKALPELCTGEDKKNYPNFSSRVHLLMVEIQC